MARLEIGDRRSEVPDAERDRARELQHPARNDRRGGDRLFGFVEIGEELNAALMERPPAFGERQAPRGAGEKARTEMGFELGDVPRHCRRRHAEAVGGAGEAALLHDLGENGTPQKGVHDYCLDIRNNLSPIIFFIPGRSSRIIRSDAPHSAHIFKEYSMSDARRIDLAAQLLRVGLGAMFIAHAALKYFVFTLPGTAKFFESLGLPGALGYVTFGAELIGGVMLVAGVYTRMVAFTLVPILVGATWAHAGNGWVFTSARGGWEYPAFLTLATLVLGLLGNGVRDARPQSPATRTARIAGVA